MQSSCFNRFRFLRGFSVVVQIFLLLGLTIQPAWATVNPYVAVVASEAPAHFPVGGEDAPIPLNNTSEECNGAGFSITEEFLHENEVGEENAVRILTQFPPRSVRTYQAYHGEQLIPPPDHT